MRVGVGLIYLGELDKSRSVSIRVVGAIQGIAIALAFEKSAQGVLYRRQQKTEERQDEHQERQSGGAFECRRAVAQRLIPQRLGQAPEDQIDQPKPDRRQDDADRDDLRQVIVNVVVDFMREDQPDL